MISGNQDEAWPMYHVWRISARFMHGWFGGTWLACCHWLNTGPVSGRCPIMFVLTQPYQCDTCFFCSTLRKLAVSNLGQLLFCRPITWSRCRNAYRDLWIMTIGVMLLFRQCTVVVEIRTYLSYSNVQIVWEVAPQSIFLFLLVLCWE